MQEIKDKGYTYEELLNTNVRAIWVYAGSLGISSPSTMKKEDLIRLVLDVQEGNIKVAPKRKKGPGRPRKNAVIETKNDTVTLSAPPADYSDPEKEYEFTGVYCGDKTGGFLSDEDYASTGIAPYIFPKLITSVTDLEDGDVVKANVVKIKDNAVPVVVDILEINGEKPEKRKIVEYCETAQLLTPEKINVNGGDAMSFIIDTFVPLYKGARGVIVADGDETGLTTAVASILKGVNKNNPNTKVIVALLSGRGDEYNYIKNNLDCECYYSSMQLGQKNNYYTTKIAFGRAKRLSSEGEDVVVVIDSVNECFEAISKGNKSLTADEAIEEIVKYFGYARNCEKGSVTVIGTLKDVDDYKVLAKRILSICGWKLALKKYLASIRTYPAIDLIDSSSRHENQLMDEAVYKAAKNIRKKIIKGEAESDEIIDEIKTVTNLDELKNILETL